MTNNPTTHKHNTTMTPTIDSLSELGDDDTETVEETQSIGPMTGLTAFQRDLLTTVTYLGKPHGLAVQRSLAETYGQEINHGRLYPNLDELVERGLLEKGERDKRTNWYRVTDAGMRALTAHGQWLDGAIIADDLRVESETDADTEASQ